ERARGEQANDSGLAAGGVETVDEVSGREQRKVFEERELDGKSTRISPEPLGELVIDEPEDRSVHGMDREAQRPPPGAAGEERPYRGNVRVVVAEEPPVDRLQRAPDRRGDGAGRCPFPAERHTLAACPERMQFTARPAGCRCSSARRSRSKRRTRAPG